MQVLNVSRVCLQRQVAQSVEDNTWPQDGAETLDDGVFESLFEM